MSESPAWEMLKGAMIDKLDGFQVTHALFTTYAFEPEFFETNIVPLLMDDRGASLSLHSAVRRLQLEGQLRESPIGIDVYFDARVVTEGAPWIPYGMHPVKLQGEFHGKVILLLLKDANGNDRCLLGAGSANLTKAGWWENVEAWHFEEPFDPMHPPAGLLDGVRDVLDMLPRRQGGVLARFKAAFRDARPKRKTGIAREFVAFTPKTEMRFLEWLNDRLEAEAVAGPVEVISPYFPEAKHATLVKRLLEATGAQRLHLWLPEDPWHAGGKAALIEKERYQELAAVKEVSWSRFGEASLENRRDKGATPRFLHAKVIRRPGDFAFMGSVNFSNKAFDLNFEAGFLFDDNGPEWLSDQAEVPSIFMQPPVAACHDSGIEDVPVILAFFNWQTLRLTINFGRHNNCADISGQIAEVLDSSGQSTGLRFRIQESGPREFPVPADGVLYQTLRGNPWIKLVLQRDENTIIVWVQQEELSYRPPPAGLEPDIWRVLDMWRGLGAVQAGSNPGDYRALELLLSRQAGSQEELPEPDDAKDIFAPIATVHGSFYALRKLLLTLAERRDPRLDYYLTSPQLDTLPTLLHQVEKTLAAGKFDVVELWVILMWIRQIGRDHAGLAAGRLIRDAAQELLLRLNGLPVMAAIDPRWRAWVEEMFLCRPGREAAVTQGFE